MPGDLSGLRLPVRWCGCEAGRGGGAARHRHLTLHSLFAPNPQSSLPRSSNFLTDAPVLQALSETATSTDFILEPTELKLSSKSRMERQEQAQPGLCAGGCGFFGSAETGNMCSKCWREELSRKRAETENMTPSTPAPVAAAAPAAAPTAPVEVQVAAPVVPAPAVVEELSSAVPAPAPSQPVAAPAPAAPATKPEPAAAARSEAKRGSDGPAITPKKKKKNRCGVCDKKVGLAGIKCRCDLFFCSVHRYPECHNCTFDYKGAERAALAEQVTGGGQFERITKI
mmetsp:Transcript_37571/g.117412  ORF Transcript_37571/g.117412 Transcript_37571/m.117412 type:complete len:284 (-) Transcript_37571:951-1802(-)